MSTFTREQVSTHCTAEDCWIIIDGQVYNVTEFLSKHPGGVDALMRNAGKDASAAFAAQEKHTPAVREKMQHFCVGSVSD